MPQQERKEILGTFIDVDKVILTRHPKNPKDMSVSKELLKIQPHIFVNGGDRSRKNVPEVKTCQNIGCKMVYNVGKGGKIQSSSWLVQNKNKPA